MNLLRWIADNRAGNIVEFDDRYELEHNSG